MKGGSRRGAEGFNFAQSWTQHLRASSKTTNSLSCPLCDSHAVHQTEGSLWEHVLKEHPGALPEDGDQAALQKAKDQIRIAAQPRPASDAPSKFATKTSHHGAFTQSKDNDGSAKPRTSSSPTTIASRLQSMPKSNFPSNEGVHTLSFAAEEGDVRSNKRLALGQGRSPSSSVKTTTSDDSPRRSKAQVSPRPTSSKAAGSSYSPTQHEYKGGEILRGPAANKRLFDPNSDSPIPQTYKVLNNAPRPVQQGQRNRKPQSSFGQPLPTPKLLQRPTSGSQPSITPVTILTANSPSPTKNTDEQNAEAFPSEPSRIASQPETRPISQQQLVAEVKGIYAGLALVEGKCIQVDMKQAQLARDAPPGAQPKLSNEQWGALIALHRTLLHEHHDFFLASQHPSTTVSVRRLAQKYSMPSRLWKHGIQAFLELLRNRLPGSLEHMISFIYMSYNMLTLLYETVPAFKDTWIECLGDLGRYRIAIEDTSARDIEVWTQVARLWYLKAANRSTGTGRLYHHVGILARTDPPARLMYYSKSLSVSSPFPGAKESILGFFETFTKDASHTRSADVIAAFVRCHAKLFCRTQLGDFNTLVAELAVLLEERIRQTSIDFRQQGYCIAISNCIALHGYKPSDSFLSKLLVGNTDEEDLAFDAALRLSHQTLAVALSREGDKNVLSLVHVVLVFTLYISRFKAAMRVYAKDFPFESLVRFLNTLPTIYENQDPPPNMSELYQKISSDSFPWGMEDPRPIPEDWSLRGLFWAEAGYWPPNWFKDCKLEAESHYLETDGERKPGDSERKSGDVGREPGDGDEVEDQGDSITKVYRPERILWIACQLAKEREWLCYDKVTHIFTLPARSFWEASDSENNSREDSNTEMGDDDDVVDTPPVSRTATLEPKASFWDRTGTWRSTERTSTWDSITTVDTDTSASREDTICESAEPEGEDPMEMETEEYSTPPTTTPVDDSR